MIGGCKRLWDWDRRSASPAGLLRPRGKAEVVSVAVWCRCGWRHPGSRWLQTWRIYTLTNPPLPRQVTGEPRSKPPLQLPHHKACFPNPKKQNDMWEKFLGDKKQKSWKESETFKSAKDQRPKHWTLFSVRTKQTIHFLHLNSTKTISVD